MAEDQDHIELEQGTYEIIRDRLRQCGKDLNAKLDELNTTRKAVFGSIETKLVATEHISTVHNCEPRDMTPIGEAFIFGYNVHIGLKTETAVSDVFSVYDYRDKTFTPSATALIKDDQFEADFKNLYKYYRDSKFIQFINRNGFIYFIFQIGKDHTDIKAFKWAILPDHTLKYIDSRSEHDVKSPSQYEFRWLKPSRDFHREGLHPHISIEDKVFVETVGGDLTIKVEDNTNTGKGIYAEPVDHRDQSLSDADIQYAVIGNIVVLKILPYQEKDYRYLVFNQKIQSVVRIDALQEACVLLPDDHGIVFSQGYYLQSGEHKIFDYPFAGLGFEKMIPSPNGEDFLYVFYDKLNGQYTTLLYNLIEQKIGTPIHCNGYSIFNTGKMCLFRADNEAKKHHSIQIWETSFLHPDLLPSSQKDSYLYKVGNKEVVRAMAECRSIVKTIEREEAYASIYSDLSRQSRNILDAYNWLSHKEVKGATIPLKLIEEASKSAIAEYDKVLRLQKTAKDTVNRLEEKITAAIQTIKSTKYDTIDSYVNTLAQLRSHRGELITSKDLRYVETDKLSLLEEQIVVNQEKFSLACVDFLLTDTALQPYEEKVNEIETNLQEITKLVEADQLNEDILSVSEELDMLIDTVNGLNIADATITTKIIDNITGIFSRFNRINAALKKSRKSIFGQEADQEFKSQLRLIHQGAANYVNISTTPEKCDDYLNRLVIQLEELEGKFSDFPEFVMPITEAREEISNAFEGHKISLIEARNNKATALHRSSERILQGVKSRLNQLVTVDDINAFVASDMLVIKVRENIKKLFVLNDSVKADELGSQLKSIRETAIRQLRDKKDLFSHGENTIKLGDHLFSVNTKKLDVTLVKKDDNMCFHLTGTNFFEPVEDLEFLATESLWNQTAISENAMVYKGEYLAYLLFEKALNQNLEVGERSYDLQALDLLTDDQLKAVIQQFMSGRYEERYTKSIHDNDAAKILKALILVQNKADLLVFPSTERASARYFWHFILSQDEQSEWMQRFKALGIVLAQNKDKLPKNVLHELSEQISTSFEAQEFDFNFDPKVAAEYLFQELQRGKTFVVSNEADILKTLFSKWVQKNALKKKMDATLKGLNHAHQLQVYLAWLESFITISNSDSTTRPIETAISLLINSAISEKNIKSTLDFDIKDMAGEHGSISNGVYHFTYQNFVPKMNQFISEAVPAYLNYTKQKHVLVETFKKNINLKSFEPKIMTSFVRNKLIDEVYLPLIGNNLSKQIGVAGQDKRTDLMGMLLLISPPGYGKTTLMEYIAQRVGLIFMKINGPALGHDITSVDPLAATNSAAREELKKLNLAFEMGDNIMIYLDDIQHCHPEFLQKFISLCDGQRKIEGVYKGKSKTYDLRGRKVMVVMAGNPYTESGERFQIPDMLANRSDIYNLGDVIGGKQDAFELSYIENCLTSNAILSRLNNKSIKDVHELVRVAVEDSREGMELEANHSTEELDDYVNLLQRVATVRDIVVKVNLEYIKSASQDDAYRQAPSFKLQGSYRDMNKIVEKLVPVMNGNELRELIMSHYQNESQTLTSAAESSLLRFKELFGVLTPTEIDRWADIKDTYLRQQKLHGVSADNQMAHVVVQMESISQALTDIGDGLKRFDNADN